MVNALTFLSLFSGIGGIELGLERAGMRCVGQVEIDEWCRSVLAKHWPEVPKHDDVRTAVEWWRGAVRPRLDGIVGGFPCQDISKSSRTSLGISGPKSSLWGAFAYAIRHLRPRFVLVENVSALNVRGLDVVLADLAALGFDAEWDTLPAAAVGAPHIRDRVFVLAYARGERHRAPADTVFAGRPGAVVHGGWPAEPDVGRVVDGVSRGLDGRRQRRLAALGNAVVPQVAEYVGRRVVADLCLAQIPRDGVVLDQHPQRVQQVGADAVVTDLAGDDESVVPQLIGDADVA